ncbi:MAG: helix-turn-helix domain-containing protein [Rhodoferax sp.]
MSTSFNCKHLCYFSLAAKEGGISRAAEKLDMAVQTVSAQVRDAASTPTVRQAVGVCDGLPKLGAHRLLLLLTQDTFLRSGQSELNVNCRVKGNSVVQQFLT